MRCRPADKLGKILAGRRSTGADIFVGKQPCGASPAARSWCRLLFWVMALGVSWAFASTDAFAADISDGEQLLRTGKYAECEEMAKQEIAAGLWEENWHRLKASAELAQGKYPQAQETLDEAIDLYPFSLQLRLLARTTYRYNGKPAKAAAMLDDVERYVSAAPRRYGSPVDRVALGRFLLERGADPRQVLELIYDPLRKEEPDFVDAYLATAELALDKYDNALAAETLRAAPKSAAKDPHYHFLLAKAYASDEPEHAEAALAAALAINPKHVDSLLFQVDHFIDAEEYAKANELLADVFAVNSQHPAAWAYKAVLAHLANDDKAEADARLQALATWKTNPEVDHLIGRKLSEKYRFAEGAEYQRRSLAMDGNYRPAKIQLSQDLLRLGDEEAGWRLADEVARAGRI